MGVYQFISSHILVSLPPLPAPVLSLSHPFSTAEELEQGLVHAGLYVLQLMPSTPKPH